MPTQPNDPSNDEDETVTEVVSDAPANAEDVLAEGLEDDEEPVEHQQLIDDIKAAIARVKVQALIDPRKELGDETYPLLQALVEHLGGRLDRVENAFDEMVEQTESFIHADLAEQIGATLQLARGLAETTKRLKPGMTLDAKVVKRLHEMADAYLTAMVMTAEAITEVSIPAPDDNEEG